VTRKVFRLLPFLVLPLAPLLAFATMVNPCTGNFNTTGLVCTGTCTPKCKKYVLTLGSLGSANVCTCGANVEPPCCFLYQTVPTGTVGVLGPCGTPCPEGAACTRVGSGTDVSPYQAACVTPP
jgi:hypothetical protein